MASLRLRTEPTLRQTEVILSRIERELGTHGARFTRGRRGELHFRMPPPWAAPRRSFLLLIGSGHVRVSAGGGDQRRLRFELRFMVLYALGALATAALLVYGWGWPRVALINSVIALWGVVLLFVSATTRRFRLLLRRCAREIVERRATPRDGTTVEGPTPPSTPSALDATERPDG